MNVSSVSVTLEKNFKVDNWRPRSEASTDFQRDKNWGKTEEVKRIVTRVLSGKKIPPAGPLKKKLGRSLL